MITAEHGMPGAPTIVFLHGGNVAGWMWGAQVPAFTDFHVLVPDLPGFGASNAAPWPGVAGAADAVAQLIRDRATGGRAHVVGLSLGSSVAMELGLRHPDVCDSLFLASAAVTPLSAASTLSTRVMLRFWGKRGFWEFLAKSYGIPADTVDEFINTGLGIRVETARAIYREVVLGVTPERLSALSTRALAVAGSKDVAAISRASLARLRTAGALVASAPGMHHQWNIENVELFNSAARLWITQNAVAEGLDTPRG